jgi:3-oxoacyl-[acyl-carrier protein] reductase
MRLNGKVALITGSSSGIGLGVARAFAREGAAVVINHPTPAEAESAARTVQAIEADGGRAVAVQADVSLEADCERLLGGCIAAFSRVDILVNNAGIAAAAPVEQIPVAQWDRVIAVHLRGTFLMTRLVLPRLYAQGWGRIINTASQLADKGAPGFAHYTAAKGAIISFTRSVALEIGTREVRINAVAPGATHTPILADVPPALLEQVRAAIPTGRIAEVDDIVPTYVFLASDEARHYQGQTLSPNGGDQFF